MVHVLIWPICLATDVRYRSFGFYSQQTAQVVKPIAAAISRLGVNACAKPVVKTLEAAAQLLDFVKRQPPLPDQFCVGYSCDHAAYSATERHLWLR